MKCGACGTVNPGEAKFCQECGIRLDASRRPEDLDPELRLVTVLFTDLSGFTSMSERLDPEELREIMQRIFGETAQIVARYEGYLDKFMGDAAMIIFGYPRAHEDDPVRAILAAAEIREHVGALSPALEPRIGRALAMHSGIQTGLVVAGELDLEKGTERVLGDTVNVASRLTSLAGAGEIVVGEETRRRAEGFFEFHALEPATVKGKADPVRAYRVGEAKGKPQTLHRLSGIRAELTGRSAELGRLREAVDALSRGSWGTISIWGEAGSGKTRLLDELRESTRSERVQWLDGQCHEYSSNASFSLLLDVLARCWGIESRDPRETIGRKIGTALRDRLGLDATHAPYIGSLFGLKYPDLEGIDAELWNSRVDTAMREILIRLADGGPTVIRLEDLHWADPSSLDFLRRLVCDDVVPALFVCTWRPGFTFLEPSSRANLGRKYQEIALRDLSPTESRLMLESLLSSRQVPSALREALTDKIEGNPFFIEEMVNGLIEKGTLVRVPGGWDLSAPLGSAEIPLSVQATLAARVDRLGKDERRLLQEAAAIGKDFSKDLLSMVTSVGGDAVDGCLDNLAERDLVRALEGSGESWFTFKHALVRDVAYSTMARKTRQEIHGKIAASIERLNTAQLPRSYELLALHWRCAGDIDAAVGYLVKSAAKNFDRYAVRESHEYYKRAYELLRDRDPRAPGDDERLIDIVNAWGIVFFLRGEFAEWSALLAENEGIVARMPDDSRKGLFHVACADDQWNRGLFREAYGHAALARSLCADPGDAIPFIGSLAWHAIISADLLKLDEAVASAAACRELGLRYKSDTLAYLTSCTGAAFPLIRTGDLAALRALAREMIDGGRSTSNKRVLFYGLWFLGYGHCYSGDWAEAIEAFESAMRCSPDPWLSIFPKYFLGVCHLYLEEYREAKELLAEARAACCRCGCDLILVGCDMALGMVDVAEGSFAKGLRTIEEAQRFWRKNEGLALYAVGELALGTIYRRISEGKFRFPVRALLKDLPSLARAAPRAFGLSESHLLRVIEMTEGRKARNLFAQASLELGILYASRGRKAEARERLGRAIALFEEGGAAGFLEQAKKALAAATA